MSLRSRLQGTGERRSRATPLAREAEMEVQQQLTPQEFYLRGLEDLRAHTVNHNLDRVNLALFHHDELMESLEGVVGLQARIEDDLSYVDMLVALRVEYQHVIDQIEVRKVRMQELIEKAIVTKKELDALMGAYEKYEADLACKKKQLLEIRRSKPAHYEVGSVVTPQIENKDIQQSKLVTIEPSNPLNGVDRLELEQDTNEKTVQAIYDKAMNQGDRLKAELRRIGDEMEALLAEFSQFRHEVVHSSELEEAKTLALQLFQNKYESIVAAFKRAEPLARSIGGIALPVVERPTLTRHLAAATSDKEVNLLAQIPISTDQRSM